MKRAPFAVVAVALLVAGCQDLTIVDSNRCDGEANPGEQRVDGPFDSDGDGFFDASNPDCAETYAADVLDCDDRNPDVSPAGTEEVCNGIDDDCDPDTVDAPDGDGIMPLLDQLVGAGTTSRGYGEVGTGALQRALGHGLRLP